MREAKKLFLSRAKMISFLEELVRAGDIVRSVYFPLSLPETEIEDFVKKEVSSPALSVDLPKLIASSKTGAILFRGNTRLCLILPPFPITEKISARGCAVKPLRSLLCRDLKIGLILVRLGTYAVGISQGERLIAGKVGTGLVHARHSKGGWSQQRYRRHREKQIESFLGRVCAYIGEQLGGQSLDFLVYGGSRVAVLQLRKSCPFLEQFDGRNLPPLLDIPEPTRAVLETAVKRVWSSRLIEWRTD